MTQRCFEPEALLQGPRGRLLCWALLDRGGQAGGCAGIAGRQPDALIAAALAAIAGCDVEAVAQTTDPIAFLDALLESVSRARYWQEPDEWDWLLAQPRMTEALEPLADALGRAPAARWWSTPVELGSQYTVAVEDPLHPERSRAAPDPTGALGRWREHTLAYERRAHGWPEDPTARHSGVWWSAPIEPGLLTSTRALGRHGPVGLSQVEDDWGWTVAHCRKLAPRPGARIFEITSPADWTELVGRYRLPVPQSRRHDWYRTTGRDERWAIPDYLAVSGDFDAIHLSVLGYLSTAQRALKAGDGHSVLAGWPPDQTWWLTEGTQETGPSVRWVLDENFHPRRSRWTPAG